MDEIIVLFIKIGFLTAHDCQEIKKNCQISIVDTKPLTFLLEFKD
jgi:hypothetical protein